MVVVSKAFTKEDAADDDSLPPYVPPWPPGSRNYVTAAGLERLRANRATALADALGSSTPEARRRLAMLNAHLDAAEVIAAPAGCDRVQFGVVVAARTDDDEPRRFAIVGVDEVDAASGRISWLSPVARALQGARVGDSVVVRLPRGDEELEILAITPLDE